MKKLIFGILFLNACLNNFDSFAQKNRTLLLFLKDDKYGYKDSVSGEILIPAKYSSAADFRDYNISPVQYNNRWGCIDKFDKVIVPFKYDAIFLFQEGMAFVMVGNFSNMKYGFIDTTGQEVIPLIYDKVYSFNQGLACVKLNNKWGFINKSGEVVIPIQYDHLAPGFHQGLAAFNIGGKETRFPKFEGGKWGYLDKKGHELIPPIYDNWTSFTGDSAYVVIGEDKFWINKKGERLK